MSETMGKIIRRLRKERNFTQEELAEQLNISSQAISKWENDSSMPDISQIVPLANVFGVSVDVLFGTDGINGDEEVEKFIMEMDVELNNKENDVTEYAHRRSCCERVQNMLTTYPNNYKLLAFSLKSIVMLLWTCRDDRFSSEIPNREYEMKEWQGECIRQANMIFHHCTAVEYLSQANRWMVSVYRMMGDYPKAEEHAKKFYEFKGTQLAVVYADRGRTEAAMKQFSQNIFLALRTLEEELPLLGYLYKKQKKYKEAYACYRLFPDMMKVMIDEDENESLYYNYYNSPCYDWCAATCVDLGLHDEAMDWLEKWLRHMRSVSENQNAITESKLPYFHGLNLRGANISSMGTMISSLAWDSFDPIRQTDRFQKIVAEAQAFERG